ncbi:MAG: DUF3094 family protein [Endozoicomonadaceae bacterium]|nr:DUF3094 family protein [Endozoicomonadaceae bacterium]
MPHSQLSKKDQKKVDIFLTSGVNQPDRQPFKPWKVIKIWSSVIILIAILAHLIKIIYLPEY